MTNKKLAFSMLGLALAGGVGAGMVGLASAAGGTATNTASMGHRNGFGPAVQGTVSSVSGTTLTVTNKSGTAYTVDASSAKILKAPETSTGTTPTPPATATVSDVAVGDTVSVRGTVSGANVTATMIVDGAFATRGPPGIGMGHGMMGGTVGTVTSINGSTITVTGKNGGTYTVDAGSATVKKSSGNALADSSVSGIAVGDTVMIHGKVVTAQVTASEIVDGVFKPSNK